MGRSRKITITKTNTPMGRKLLIEEVIFDLLNGTVAKASKTYSYRVRRIPSISSSQSKRPRNVSIEKRINPITGLAFMRYRVISSFMIEQNKQHFAVGFMHKIEFTVLNREIPQNVEKKETV